MSITTLAASQTTDTLVISGLALAMVTSAVNMLWQAWLQSKFRSFQNIKDENKQQASELIKREIASVELKLIARIDRIADVVSSMATRLERGDHKFDSIAEQDKKLEMKLMAMSNDLKDYIRETCAGANRVEKIEANVAHLQRQVDQQNRGTL